MEQQEATEIKPYDVIVVGAGAAGMMAAGTAARNGNRVLLIEKMEKSGRKVRITGKGRCNVTNARPAEEFASQVRTNAEFFTQAFAEFNLVDAQGFSELFQTFVKHKHTSYVRIISLTVRKYK